MSVKHDRRFLTKRDLADRLAVHPRTINRMVDRGELPKPIRLGGDPRWASDEIEAFERCKMEARDR